MLSFTFDNKESDFADLGEARDWLEKLKEEIEFIMLMQEHCSRPTLTQKERAANEDTVNNCAATLATLQRKKSEFKIFLKNAEDALTAVRSP
ncbi:PH domain-containing protein [Caenorhabditis elegans]|uniref:PH domain-containing protein n=1 Tax=Caenorhabditis elegans TaxID=6239 RepID=A5JYW3_CAEEL|nr:PH domain-containing protein [Caenorhabditis elegans]CAN86577.1 PH domain-containing protein [Caenorhabditis elegans]|eukprot:NP_001122859.1 Uncharacterized protein CELE_C25F9.11 [Caenorhabditis elegans]